MAAQITNHYIIAYGSWYGEDLDYLNESDNRYSVPLSYWNGYDKSATLTNGDKTDHPIIHYRWCRSIPVVMVIDEEGYVIERQITGSPVDKWSGFNSVVELALTTPVNGTEDLRIAWEEPSTSYFAVFALNDSIDFGLFFTVCVPRFTGLHFLLPLTWC